MHQSYLNNKRQYDNTSRKLWKEAPCPHWKRQADCRTLQKNDPPVSPDENPFLLTSLQVSEPI